MNYQLETEDKQAYLASTKYMDWQHPLIQQKAAELFHDGQSELEKIKAAFTFVRDSIPHTGDIGGHDIAHTAVEALEQGHAVCYVKSMLLAALLRSQGIATGLCYQRLARANDHIIHALNAVYLSGMQKWVRVDARGNLPGKEAEFYIDAPDKEQLVFHVRAEMDEIDYPTIYAEPPAVTTNVLEENTDCAEVLKCKLPERL